MRQLINTYEQQFHYGVFYAYMRLREQEIRNIMCACCDAPCSAAVLAAVLRCDVLDAVLAAAVCCARCCAGCRGALCHAAELAAALCCAAAATAEQPMRRRAAQVSLLFSASFLCFKLNAFRIFFAPRQVDCGVCGAGPEEPGAGWHCFYLLGWPGW